MEYKSNYNQYRCSVEAWLQSTYPSLYAIWQQAFYNVETTSNNDMDICIMCRVKPSSGTHYGVKICEADKQFLKRTFHYKLLYSPCTKEREGLVCLPRPRGWCQMCRLRTCLATPINISMIRVGEKIKAQKTKKSVSEKQNKEEHIPTTFQMTIHHPKQEPLLLQQFADNFSFPSWSQPTVFQAYPTTNSAPSFYDIPSFYRTPSPPVIDEYSQHSPIQNKFLTPEVSDCTPLDLSVKPNLVQVDDQWFVDELTFADDLPTKLMVLQTREEPLDLTIDFSSISSSTGSSPIKSCFSKPSSFSLDFSKSSLLRPSSADGRIRSTPSPVLEASYGLNKLSVNSTVLGDALAQIQANISNSSLANLSSVSDILTDGDK